MPIGRAIFNSRIFIPDNAFMFSIKKLVYLKKSSSPKLYNKAIISRHFFLEEDCSAVSSLLSFPIRCPIRKLTITDKRIRNRGKLDHVQ